MYHLTKIEHRAVNGLYGSLTPCGTRGPRGQRDVTFADYRGASITRREAGWWDVHPDPYSTIFGVGGEATIEQVHVLIDAWILAH